jgi:hypothetical protein
MMVPLAASFKKYRLALLGLSMAAGLWAGSEPPVRDSIRLSAAVMVQGESAPAPFFSGDWCKVPSKKLPSSISVYLKPSNVIDSHSGPVRKAAHAALGLLGPGAAKAALDDPRLLAEAVRAWVDLNLGPPDENYEPRPYAIDLRLLLPKASQLITIGQADWPGKVRVRLALLRALGVPARACQFRGEAALEYWAQWIQDEKGPREAATKSKSKLKKGGPSKPKGEWVLDETAFAGETVEAWSMDAEDLAPALWLPEQELAYESSLERAYYSLSETTQALAALDEVKRDGRLPQEAAARALPPRQGAWLLVANHRARFSTEGAMEALDPMELLLPYRPKLASWGSQARPVPESLETLAQAFWTDRPDRIHVKKAGWTDEYKSPPPAYGMLHYASLKLRKPASVLDATLSGAKISGKLLRRNSLAPRANWQIVVTAAGLTKTAKTDAQGGFSLDLGTDLPKGGWIKVSGGDGSADQAVGDSLLLEAAP